VTDGASRSTVFITNMASDHDYKSATVYGALRPITTGNYPVFKSGRLLEEIAASLSQSEETDYLLFSGSSFIAGICLAVWLQRHKECKSLLYDKSQRGYASRVIRKSDIIIQLEKARGEDDDE